MELVGLRVEILYEKVEAGLCELEVLAQVGEMGQLNHGEVELLPVRLFQTLVNTENEVVEKFCVGGKVKEAVEGKEDHGLALAEVELEGPGRKEVDID